MPTSPLIQVRPASLDDAKAIAELHVAASKSAYQDLISADQWDRVPMAKRVKYWREAIEYAEPQVWVATQGEEMIGFVGFDRSRDPKSKPTTGEIWAIYVLESHWDQGVGVELWDAAREGLLNEDCTDVTVWLPIRNERAVRFHELAGFKREMNTARTAMLDDVKIEEVRLKRSLA